MSIRQVGCTDTVILTEAEYTHVLALPCTAHEPGRFRWCTLEPQHDGPHHTLAQTSLDDDWWFRWDNDGLREFAILPLCPIPNPADDEQRCLLYLGHPGRHGFEYDVDDTAIPARTESGFALPSGPLAPHQQDNIRFLGEVHRLSVEIFLRLGQLAGVESVMGTRSTKHLGLTTSVPHPQLLFVDSATPGLREALACGYLAAPPHPPYEPLDGTCGGDRLIVYLTDAGRAVYAAAERHMVE